MSGTSAPRYALALYLAGLILVGGYFALASIQGDYGLFRRVQIEAEINDLKQLRDELQIEVTQMTNKTRRLSDEYLDLDLLDQQARDILGMARHNEIIIN